MICPSVRQRTQNNWRDIRAPRILQDDDCVDKSHASMLPSSTQAVNGNVGGVARRLILLIASI